MIAGLGFWLKGHWLKSLSQGKFKNTIKSIVWICMSVNSCHAYSSRYTREKQLLKYKGWLWENAALETGIGLIKLAVDKGMIKMSPPTFYFWHKAKALLEVRADAVEAPAELGVAAVLVGAACVVTHIQLIATFGHGGDAHVHLEQDKGDECVCKWKWFALFC